MLRTTTTLLAALAVQGDGTVQVPSVIATLGSQELRSFGSFYKKDDLMYVSSVGVGNEELLTVDVGNVWSGGSDTLTILSNTTYEVPYNVCPGRYTPNGDELHATSLADLTLDTTNPRMPVPLNKTEGGYMAVCFFNNTDKQYVARLGYNAASRSAYFFTAMRDTPTLSLANITLGEPFNINTKTYCQSGKVFFNSYVVDVTDPVKPFLTFKLPFDIIDDIVLRGDVLYTAIEYDYYNYNILAYNVSAKPVLLSNYTLPIIKQLEVTHIVGDAWLSLQGNNLFSLLPGWGILSTDVSNPSKPVPSMPLFSVNCALPFGFHVEVVNGTAYGVVLSDKLYFVSLWNM